MRHVFLLLLSLSSLSAQTPVAPAPAAPPLPGNEAAVSRKSGPPSNERIVSADASGFSVLTGDGRGVIKISYDQIASVRFDPPAGWDEISKFIKEGKMAEAESRMLPIANKMAPLTALKGGDASKYVFAYTDVLRSLGKYQAAATFLEKAPFPADAPVVDRARRLIVKAYCLAMLGKIDEAEVMLNQVQAPGDKSSLFTIYQLARARVYAQKKDNLSALDDIAHIIAVKRLGSESYDEALFQSAEAYDTLAQSLAAQKEAVEKDDRLSRQMQQDRMDAISRFQIIKSEPLQVAAIWDITRDYGKCATSARLQLCRVYPTSPWTVKAFEKLPDDVKKMLDEEAGRDPEVEAKKSMGETTKPKEVPDEKARKDRTGRDAPKDSKEPKGEVLKLDETTEEKDGL